MDATVTKNGLWRRVDERVVFHSPNGLLGECTLSFAVGHVTFFGLGARRINLMHEIANGVAMRSKVDNVVVPVNDDVVSCSRHSCTLNVSVPLLVFPALLRGRVRFQRILSFRVYSATGTHYASALLTIKRLCFVVGLCNSEFLYGQCTKVRRFLQVFNSLSEFIRLARGRETNDRRHSVRCSGGLRALRANIRTNTRAVPSLFQRGEDVDFHSANCPNRRVKYHPQQASRVLMHLTFDSDDDEPSNVRVLHNATSGAKFLSLTIGPLVRVSREGRLCLILLHEGDSAARRNERRSRRAGFLLGRFSR